MDDGARLWMFKHAQKNFWRVSRFYEFDDLVQDGYMCYAICVNRYKDIKTPEHLMSLFKITYINHIHDLATKQSICAEQPVADLPPQLAERLADLVGAEDVAVLSLMMKQAPEPIKQVLQLFQNEEKLKILRSAFREREGGRETFNERLCKLIGLDPKKNNLPAMIKNYFAA